MSKSTKVECPQCGRALRHNDAGAWCENYPCRYAFNRRKVETAAELARAIWGDDE
jgi:hypothetical protein